MFNVCIVGRWVKPCVVNWLDKSFCAKVSASQTDFGSRREEHSYYIMTTKNTIPIPNKNECSRGAEVRRLTDYIQKRLASMTEIQTLTLALTSNIQVIINLQLKSVNSSVETKLTQHFTFNYFSNLFIEIILLQTRYEKNDESEILQLASLFEAFTFYNFNSLSLTT